MKNKEFERAGKDFHPKLKILFLYGVFFGILGILDRILNCFTVSN